MVCYSKKYKFNWHLYVCIWEPRGLGFKFPHPQFVLRKRKVQKLYEWSAHSHNVYNDVRNVMIVMDAHSLARSNWKARCLFWSWFLLACGKDQLLSPPCWHSALHNHWQQEINRKVMLSFFLVFWEQIQRANWKQYLNHLCKVIPPAPPDLAVVSSMSFGSITISTSSA